MPTSKLQNRVKELIGLYCPEYEIWENYRPYWLEQSNGARLEIDLFIEKINTGFEIQGEQHFRYVEFFHRDYQGFLEQIERDKEKQRMCEKNGVTLLEVCDEADAVLSVLSIVEKTLTPQQIKREIELLNMDLGMYQSQIHQMKSSIQSLSDFLSEKTYKLEGKIKELKRLQISKTIGFQKDSDNPMSFLPSVYKTIKQINKRSPLTDEEWEIVENIQRYIRNCGSDTD